jgi:hypothetical protein
MAAGGTNGLQKRVGERPETAIAEDNEYQGRRVLRGHAVLLAGRDSFNRGLKEGFDGFARESSIAVK